MTEREKVQDDALAFAAWLTSRPGVLTVGSGEECGPLAEAVAEWRKANPLRAPASEGEAWECLVCDESNPATKMYCGRCGTLGMRAPASEGEACRHLWRGLGGGAQCARCGKQVPLHEDICKAIGAFYAAVRAPASEGEAVAFTERGEPYPTDVAALTGIEWDARELRNVGGMRHDVARLFAHYTVNEASEPVSAELLNLARAYLCLLATHPAPATVTEAMCKAAMREHAAQMGEPFDSLWNTTDASTRATLLDEWKHILTAALGGAR